MQKRELTEDSLQQAKKLGKNFRVAPVADIQLLLQFCEWNEPIVRCLLTFMETMKKPGVLLQQLLEKPEKTDEIIRHYLDLYEKRFGSMEVHHEQHNYSKQSVRLLNELPSELIMEIAMFLDPKEMWRFMTICGKFWQTLKNSSFRSEEYFKRICRTLFRSLEPQLPETCQFNGIRDYVLANPHEFSPNIRNYVQSNVRQYIWQCTPHDLRISPNYYKSMGKFEDIYYTAPRVHYNGYYMLRERYVRPAAQNILLSAPKYTVIYYYRYVRFILDGSLLYTFSNNKLKEGQIMERLSLKNFTTPSETIKGQHMQFKDRLFFKISKSNTIFSFECKISSVEGLFDLLEVQKFNLQIVDESYVVQDINKEKQNELHNFVYVRSQLIADENPLSIQSCSL